MQGQQIITHRLSFVLCPFWVYMMNPDKLKPGKNFTEADRQAAKNLKRIWIERKDELGLTQKEVADKLGISQSGLSNYMNGHTVLGFEATMKIAHFLGVPPQLIRPDIMQSWFALSGQQDVDSSEGAVDVSLNGNGHTAVGELPAAVSETAVLSGPGLEYLRERNPLDAELINAREEVEELRRELQDLDTQFNALTQLFAKQVSINSELKSENSKLKQERDMLRQLIADLKASK